MLIFLWQHRATVVVSLVLSGCERFHYQIFDWCWIMASSNEVGLALNFDYCNGISVYLETSSLGDKKWINLGIFCIFECLVLNLFHCQNKFRYFVRVLSANAKYINTIFMPFQTLPVIVGVAVVAITTVVFAKMFLFRKKKAPVTLQDPAVKYSLKLVDKEVNWSLYILCLLWGFMYDLFEEK